MSGQKDLGGKPDILITLTRGKVAALSSIHLLRLEIFWLRKAPSSGTDAVAALPLSSQLHRRLFRWWHSLRAGNSCEEPSVILGLWAWPKHHVIALFQAGHCQAPTAWPLFKWGTSRLDSMALFSLLHEGVTLVQVKSRPQMVTLYKLWGF